MANTTLMDGKWIDITLDGATDWDLATEMTHKKDLGLKVRAITIVVTADNDVVIIRNSATANQTSPAIARCKGSADHEQFRYEFGDGSWMKPSMKAADLVGTTYVLIELA